MRVNNGFAVHCLALLSALGLPRARRMFGGHGLYVDGQFVALILNERLHLKPVAAMSWHRWLDHIGQLGLVVATARRPLA